MNGWPRPASADDQLFRRTAPGPNGCLEWQGYRGKKGYGELKVDGKMEKTHRQAYRLRVGDIPDGLQVLHECDNPPCVNPDHLFLGTNLDNIADRVRKGRSSRQVTTAKLTVDDVAAIRRLAATGTTNIDIAGEYNISNQNVSQIVLRRTWKEIA